MYFSLQLWNYLCQYYYGEVRFFNYCSLVFLELPVSSPICHAVLKTLQRWEQVLLRRLELYGGPPQHYISVHASEDALAAGPALLRHKTLLEPTNTPFR